MSLQQLPPQIPIIVQDEDDSALTRYLATLLDQRWLVLKATLLMALAGGLYACVARPVYEASMLIHVEEPSAKEANNILGEMATLFEVKTTTPSEMELLRSRLVITRAIDDLHLLIDVRPYAMPLIGRWLADHSRQTPLGKLLGVRDDLRASSPVVVTRLDLPMAMEGADFELTIGPNNSYRLIQRAYRIDAAGRVGDRLSIEAEPGNVSFTVGRIDASPGTRFIVRRRPSLAMVEEVQKSMTITEQGKQSGIIGISLRGDDSHSVHDLLQQIGQQYIAQNLARKLEESQKSLAFLDRQLPDLKQKLERAEVRYSQFRNQNSTVNLGEEEKIALQQVASAKARRLLLQQRRIELLPHFTPNHPTVIAIDQQIREINAEISSVTGHIRSMPLLEQEVQRLNREVKVNTDLYTALSNTAQQLRLITIGKVGNVRLVDVPMMPDAPIGPNRVRITLLAALAGLLGSMLLVLARKGLYGGIDAPEQIESLLQIPVFATIPHSHRQEDLQRYLPGKSGKLCLLAHVASDDVAVESMRTFRTALQFSMTSARNNIVMFTGPMPGVGKTFLCVNMAVVVAMTGKRVLLIDSDFRNGLLHAYFDVKAQGGLSDYLQGSHTLAQVINRSVVPHLDFIATGSLPQHPAELLLNSRLGSLMAALTQAYDLVLIDAAPTLAVSDCLVVGSHAGSIYLVARAGSTTGAELQESAKRMQQAGLHACGVLFNDLKLRCSTRYGAPYPYGRFREMQVGWSNQSATAVDPTVTAAVRPPC